MTSQTPIQLGLREVLAGASEAAPWPMLILDQDLYVLHGNRAARELLNEGKNLVERTDFSSFFSPVSFQAIQAFLQDCLGQGEEKDSLLPVRCLLQIGEEQEREIELRTELLEEKNHLSLVVYLSDPSETFCTNSVTLDRDLAYRSILDNTGAVVYIKDVQGRYQFVNRLFEETFHTTLEEIVGLTDYDFFSHEMADRFRKIDEQVCLTGETLRLQEIAPHDDGNHNYISVKFPLYNAQDQLIGMAGISTDITEQLHAQQELKAAQAVQKLLYPEMSPELEGYEIAGRVSPAEKVSGDYFDYIWLSPDRLVIAVGDVSGHGLGPALEMIETRSYLRAILRTEVKLDVVMECLNEFLYRDLRDSAFVTLFLVEIDFKTNSFTYVGAGHTAYLLKANGSSINLRSTGLMLGIESHINYSRSACYFLEPGDLLLILTDGITEAMSPQGELFGHERTLDLLKTKQNHSVQDLINMLIDQALHFPGMQSQADDMTAVAIRRNI